MTARTRLMALLSASLFATSASAQISRGLSLGVRGFGRLPSIGRPRILRPAPFVRPPATPPRPVRFVPSGNRPQMFNVSPSLTRTRSVFSAPRPSSNNLPSGFRRFGGVSTGVNRPATSNVVASGAAVRHQPDPIFSNSIFVANGNFSFFFFPHSAFFFFPRPGIFFSPFFSGSFLFNPFFFDPFFVNPFFPTSFGPSVFLPTSVFFVPELPENCTNQPAFGCPVNDNKGELPPEGGSTGVAPSSMDLRSQVANVGSTALRSVALQNDLEVKGVRRPRVGLKVE